MKIISEHPFLEYDCYKNLHKGMGRWQVCFVHKSDKKNRRTILYSKYLMSVKTGRILTDKEQVDHVDGDKLNDCMTNLEIVSPEENFKRWSEKQNITTVSISCPGCDKIFERARNKTHFVIKTKKRTFCSRQCSGKYNGKKKLY